MYDITSTLAQIEEAFQSNNEELVRKLLDEIKNHSQKNLNKDEIDSLNAGLAHINLDIYTQFENPNSDNKKIPTSERMEKLSQLYRVITLNR